jgi:putative NADH-flavin reductase
LKLVILGAAGQTGSQLVEQALAAGHDVTAFVRPTHLLTIKSPKLRVITGDARNTADLKKAIAGQDAVLDTVSSNNVSGDLMSKSADALVQAMKDTGVKRVLLMSAFFLSSDQKPGFLTGIMKGLMGNKVDGEATLRDSGLDWTTVHPTVLTNGPLTGNQHVVPATQTVGLRNRISRADVAAFMLSRVTDESTFGKQIVITTK